MSVSRSSTYSPRGKRSTLLVLNVTNSRVGFPVASTTTVQILELVVISLKPRDGQDIEILSFTISPKLKS